MYCNATPSSTLTPSALVLATAPHRPYAHLGLRLESKAFGGGTWRLRCTRSGRTLGTIYRTPGRWRAVSVTHTYQSNHHTRADATLALASYARMLSVSPAQLRYAKATRAMLTQLVSAELTNHQLEAFHRFIESQPRFQIAAWWLRHRPQLLTMGWDGFKAALRKERLTSPFMAIWGAIDQRPGTPPLPIWKTTPLRLVTITRPDGSSFIRLVPAA